MMSLRALKKSMKDVDSRKKKKKREGSGEGCRRESGCVDDAGDGMIRGEESVFAQAPKAQMPSPEDFEMEMDRASGGSGPVNVDGITSAGVMLDEATGLHARKNKRKASSSPEEKGGANEGKKVKIGTEVEGKTTEKGTEAESMVGRLEGSFSIRAGPIEERNESGENLAARRVKRRKRDNKKSGGSGSNSSGSPAGIGVAPTVPKIAVVVTPHKPRR